jgi:hypothetical protein
MAKVSKCCGLTNVVRVDGVSQRLNVIILSPMKSVQYLDEAVSMIATTEVIWQKVAKHNQTLSELVTGPANKVVLCMCR